MSFLQDIFGYPTDRLTPIRAQARQEHGDWKMYGEYRQGKHYYIYELTSSGSNMEEWLTDALQLQMAYLNTRKTGELYKFFHGPAPLVRSNRAGNIYCLLIEEPGEQEDAAGRPLPKRSHISFHLWTDKAMSTTDKELAIKEGLEFIQLTCEKLTHLFGEKNGLLNMFG
jgi:hypothetical protein